MKLSDFQSIFIYRFIENQFLNFLVKFGQGTSLRNKEELKLGIYFYNLRLDPANTIKNAQ